MKRPRGFDAQYPRVPQYTPPSVGGHTLLPICPLPSVHAGCLYKELIKPSPAAGETQCNNSYNCFHCTIIILKYCNTALACPLTCDLYCQLPFESPWQVLLIPGYSTHNTMHRYNAMVSISVLLPPIPPSPNEILCFGSASGHT